METMWGDLGEHATTGSDNFEQLIDLVWGRLHLSDIEVVLCSHIPALQLSPSLKKDSNGNGIYNSEIGLVKCIQNWSDFAFAELSFVAGKRCEMHFFPHARARELENHPWYSPHAFVNLTDSGPLVLWQRTFGMDAILNQLLAINSVKLPYESVEPGKQILRQFCQFYLSTTDHLEESLRKVVDWKYLMTLED